MDVMWDLVYEWKSCGTWFMNGRHVGLVLGMDVMWDLVYEWKSCGTWFMNGRHVRLGL